MPIIREPAPAKINLTLEIVGRRPDGYHELVSLVAFASVGDQLELDTSEIPRVEVTGPFAAFISGPNILDRTLELLAERAPALKLGAVCLEKNLPVAAGLGGGSSNAAALLRAVRAANPDQAPSIDWQALAVTLGADVAVCLERRAAWMTGIGENVAPLAEPLPQLFAVIANPLAEVPSDKTARVFRELRAPPLEGIAAKEAPVVKNRATLLAIMRESGNDLARAAQIVVPEMAVVLEALASALGAEIASVSGAGPSCFAVFASEVAATRAAEQLKADHPSWWIVSTVIR